MRFSPGCGCCGDNVACAECDGGTGPSQLQIDITGVVDGTCTTCNETLNGTFVLDFTGASGGFCTWTSAQFTSCVSSFSTTYYWQIDINDPGSITVNLWNVAEFFPAMTFVLTPQDGDCLNWSALDIPLSVNMFPTCTGGVCALTSL